MSMHCNHRHHSHDEVEPEREMRIERVLSEKGLQEFFPNDMTHLEKGRYQFAATQRTLACGQMVVSDEVMKSIQQEADYESNVFSLAKMSMINGCKQASNLAPLMYGTHIEQIKTRITLDQNKHTINLYCYVAAFANRPVESEAMASVSAGMLAIYDHFKHMDPALAFGEVKLLFKENGQEGLWFNPNGIPEEVNGIFMPPIQFMKNIRVVIVSVSDKALNGSISDAGKHLQMRIEEQGAEVIEYKLLPSKKEVIVDYVTEIVNKMNPHVVMLRGAVGISPYDETPFATKALCERMIPGLGELLRVLGSRYTSGAWNACCEAGVLNRTLIISLPGARKAIDEIMQVIPITVADAVGHLQEISLEADHADEVDIPCRMWI